MITLYTLPPAFGLRNVSPFCLKVEMTLTQLGLPFDLKLEGNPGKAPKGKLPFLEMDGRIIADSELILDALEEKTGKVYGELSADERAIGVAFTRLAEEHLYWLMVASRWLEPDWQPHVKAGFFGVFPALLRPVIFSIALRQVKQAYHLQGLGRHSREEEVQFARRDLSAISDRVAGHRYVTGGRLTVFDFNVASILVGLMDNEPATWMSELAKEYAPLREYVDRIQAEVNVYAGY